MQFADLDPEYYDRQSKIDFVWEKYKQILSGTVLDVGADRGHLRTLVPAAQNYTGIGFGEGVDVECDLEVTPYQFPDDTFDTVICLDVLEHLENVHKVFDELCRISRKYILISLPNPYSELLHVLKNKPYSVEKNLKFYGLPACREADRHRWFFSPKEARSFVQSQAVKNGLTILHHYPKGHRPGLRGMLSGAIFRIAVGGGIPYSEFICPTMWWVLQHGKKSV